MRSPRWTVLTNVVSPESNEFVGQCREFFFEEDRAEDCRKRWERAGSTPMKRPFNEKQDREHMHCLAKGSWRSWTIDSDLRQLPGALCEREEFQRFGFEVRAIMDQGRSILVLESTQVFPGQVVDLHTYFREDGRLGIIEVAGGLLPMSWVSVKLPVITEEVASTILKKLVPKLREKYSSLV